MHILVTPATAAHQRSAIAPHAEPVCCLCTLANHQGFVAIYGGYPARKSKIRAVHRSIFEIGLGGYTNTSICIFFAYISIHRLRRFEVSLKDRREGSLFTVSQCICNKTWVSYERHSMYR